MATSTGLPAASTATACSLDATPESWVTSSLASLSVSTVASSSSGPASPRVARTLSLSLSPGMAAVASIPMLLHAPSPLDKLRQLEAYVKGREGSRQRRRWENDHLIGVPHAHGPLLPIDRHAQPTHTVVDVHYHLAHYWERGLRQRADDEAERRLEMRKAVERAAGRATGAGHGDIPRGLRDVLKRSPALGMWVRVIEEQIRRVAGAAAAPDGGDWVEVRGDDADDQLELDEGSELVLVGRRRHSTSTQLRARDLRGSDACAPSHAAFPRGITGVVFDNLGEGEGAAFKRWLIHSIAKYYYLDSRSASVGSSQDAHRAVYVFGHGAAGAGSLPRPLSEVCLSGRK